jgi:hypothetical protein
MLLSEVTVEVRGAGTSVISKFRSEILDNNRRNYSLSRSRYAQAEQHLPALAKPTLELV